MSINLLTSVQENLGLPAIKKIDPNTQKVKVDDEGEKEFSLTQASLTSALAGIFNLAKSEEGLKIIGGKNISQNWATVIFGNNVDEIVKNIAAYASVDVARATGAVNKIAGEAIRLIREKIPGEKAEKEIRSLVSGQRDFVLPYLPAALGLGKLLDDNTLDDPTNKMEGPFSSLLHKIEKGFSGSETEEEAQKNK